MIISREYNLMLAKFGGAWQKFWFKEISPEPLALFRILLGFVILQVSLCELIPNFSLLFGAKGMLNTSSVAVYWWHQATPIFDAYLLLPQADIYRLTFFCVFLLFTLFLTIGFCTRFSTIIVFLGLMTFDRHCPLVLDAGDDFMRIVTFLMIFAPSGEAFSLDRILKAKWQKKSLQDMPLLVVSPWVQRMLQLQLSLAYLCAFLPKTFGQQWQMGTAVYYASRLTDFAKFPLPDILTQFPLCRIPTYYTLLVELSMCTLVWYRPARYWVLLAAVLMHLGIDWTMNIPGFEMLFISTCVLFIEPNDLRRVLAKFQSLFKFESKTKNVNWKNAVNLPEYNYMFLPMLVFISVILVIGSLLGNPIRNKFEVLEKNRNYNERLSTALRYWQERLNESLLPSGTEEQRLTAKEALGVLISLTKNYSGAGQLLRSASNGRAEQKISYNPALISSLSCLANLYLESGHLDASELCYKTILDYDREHLANAPNRQIIELNNLGVVSYVRGLLAKNKTDERQKYIESDQLFRQALSSSTSFENKSNPGFREIKADILYNRYLVLRDLGLPKAAQKAKLDATRLLSAPKKPSLL